MKTKIIYICEICNGSYATENLAYKCEASGYPKYYNEFVNKWLIIPIQRHIHEDKLESSIVNSKIEWNFVRVEENEILSPQNFDVMKFLNITPIAHSLKLKTRSFYHHFVIKDYLKHHILVPEKYFDEISNLLVENEINKNNKKDNEITLQKVKELMEKILKELNIILPELEGIEKYEYKSNI